MAEKREFRTYKFEFIPGSVGAFEIHTPTIAEVSDAILYATEVDIENAVGGVDVLLMLHWDDMDFHLVLGEWMAHRPITHHMVDLPYPLPVKEGSNFHLRLSNTGADMKVTFRILLEELK